MSGRRSTTCEAGTAAGHRESLTRGELELLPYSTRFILVSDSTLGWTDFYTVPAGRVAIVKCVTALLTAATDEFALTVNRAAHIARRKAATASEYNLWNMGVVLNAGDILSVYLFQGSVNMSVSGYLLTA